MRKNSSIAKDKINIMEIRKIAEAVGEYLMPQLKEITARLDKIEVRQAEMDKRLDNMGARINDMGSRISDLARGQAAIHARLDSLSQGLNTRLDNLYQIVVRRDEHLQLDMRLRKVEEKLAIA